MSALMQEMNKINSPVQMRRRTGSGGVNNSPEAFLKSVLTETVRDSTKTPVLSLGGMFSSQTTPQKRPEMKPLKKPIAIKTIPTSKPVNVISPKINQVNYSPTSPYQPRTNMNMERRYESNRQRSMPQQAEVHTGPTSPYQRNGMNMERRYENNRQRSMRSMPQQRSGPHSNHGRRSPPASCGPRAGNNRLPTRPLQRHRSPNPVPELSAGKALPHEKVMMLQAWARYHPRKKNFLPRVGMHAGPLTAFQIVKLTMFSPIKFQMDPSDPKYEEIRLAIAHINSWILPKSLKCEDTAKYLARAGPRPGHAEDRLINAGPPRPVRSDRFSQ